MTKDEATKQDIADIIEKIEELNLNPDHIADLVIKRASNEITNDILEKMKEMQRSFLIDVKEQIKRRGEPEPKHRITKEEFTALLDEKLSRNNDIDWDIVAEKMAKKLMQIFNETEEKTDIETEKTDIETEKTTEIKVKEQPTKKQIAEAKTEETPSLKEVLTEATPTKKGFLGLSY